MSFTPKLCDIYRGSNSYNSDKNIVRVATKFDKTDLEDLIFDVPLTSLGVYKTPDFRYHKILVFFPDGLEKKSSINDPANTPVGSESPTIPLGILIDNQQYKKLMGSIGNAAFKGGGDVGTQYPEDMDFFIPTGFKRTAILDDSNKITEYDSLSKTWIQKEPDNSQEIPEELRVCGIGGAKDGSIILRGTCGEIVIGEKGIVINGSVKFNTPNNEKTGMATENITLLELIPKSLVTPFPNRLPNLKMAMNIAGIISKATTVIGKIKEA
jgi:hypothetical protein